EETSINPTTHTEVENAKRINNYFLQRLPSSQLPTPTSSLKQTISSSSEISGVNRVTQIANQVFSAKNNQSIFDIASNSKIDARIQEYKEIQNLSANICKKMDSLEESLEKTIKAAGAQGISP